MAELEADVFPLYKKYYLFFFIRTVNIIHEIKFVGFLKFIFTLLLILYLKKKSIRKLRQTYTFGIFFYLFFRNHFWNQIHFPLCPPVAYNKSLRFTSLKKLQDGVLSNEKVEVAAIAGCRGQVGWSVIFREE